MQRQNGPDFAVSPVVLVSLRWRSGASLAVRCLVWELPGGMECTLEAYGWSPTAVLLRVRSERPLVVSGFLGDFLSKLKGIFSCILAKIRLKRVLLNGFLWSARPLVSKSPRSLDEPWVRKWKRFVWCDVPLIFGVILSLWSSSRFTVPSVVSQSGVRPRLPVFLKVSALVLLRPLRLIGVIRRVCSRCLAAAASLTLEVPLVGVCPLARRFGRTLHCIVGAESRGSACPRAFTPRSRHNFFCFCSKESYLVDPASSHMLVSKTKPCMSKFTLSHGETANGSLNQSRFLR